MGFAAGEAAYSRWRLDGSNLVARLRVDDAAAPIGYDPSGSYLLVQGSLGISAPARGPRDGCRRRRGRHRRPGGGGPRCGRVRVGRRRAAGLLGAARRRTARRREPTHRRRPGPGGRRRRTCTQTLGRDCLGDHRGRWSNRRPELDLGIGTDPEPFVEVAGAVYGVDQHRAGTRARHPRLGRRRPDHGVRPGDRRTAGLGDAGRGRHRVERHRAARRRGRRGGRDRVRRRDTPTDREPARRAEHAVDTPVRRQRVTHAGHGARPDRAGLRHAPAGPASGTRSPRPPRTAWSRAGSGRTVPR